MIDVLICDDDEAIRDLLSFIVGGREGLRVVGEAQDGGEAITESARLLPDVILLDLSMPRQTGLDALPEIKRAAPDARVIVFSGFAAANMAGDALARGADRYLEKGARPDVITAAIEEVARSSLGERSASQLV